MQMRAFFFLTAPLQAYLLYNELVPIFATSVNKYDHGYLQFYKIEKRESR